MHGEYTPNEVARFWAKVAKSDACWLWTGAIHGRGYGSFATCRHGKATVHLAHRFVYALVRGPIPVGLMVLHRCDVKLCVRPDHLFLGTAADNTADMMAKGRGTSTPGERHAKALLTDAKVREIRDLHLRHGIPQNVLAVRFGVAASTIWSVVRRASWRHLD